MKKDELIEICKLLGLPYSKKNMKQLNEMLNKELVRLNLGILGSNPKKAPTLKVTKEGKVFRGYPLL